MFRSLTVVFIFCALAVATAQAEVRGISMPISCERAGEIEIMNGSTLTAESDHEEEVSLHYKGAFYGVDATVIHQCKSGSLNVQAIQMKFLDRASALSKYHEVIDLYRQRFSCCKEETGRNDVDFVWSESWKLEGSEVPRFRWSWWIWIAT